MRSYVLLFLTTGTLAVLIRWFGEHSEARLAGLIAMVPLKIVIAWWILGSVGGTAAVRESIPGMAVGLVAVGAYMGAGWLVAGRVGVEATILTGLAAWMSVALLLRAPD